MKSLPRQLWLDEAAVKDTVTPVFHPQRTADENGALQIAINQDPGGAAAGLIAVESKVHANAEYVITTSVDISTLTGLASYPHSTITIDVPILGSMRIAMRDNGVSAFNIPNGGTTFSVWLVE